MQLADAGYQAFRVADNNMYEINLNIARIPVLMNDLLEMFNQENMVGNSESCRFSIYKNNVEMKNDVALFAAKWSCQVSSFNICTKNSQ